MWTGDRLHDESIIRFQIFKYAKTNKNKCFLRWHKSYFGVNVIRGKRLVIESSLAVESVTNVAVESVTNVNAGPQEVAKRSFLLGQLL